MRTVTITPTPRHGPTFTFVRHVVEMTVAMTLGMVVLGMAFRQLHLALFGSGFDDLWHDHTALAVFGMAFNMTFPMVVLMRHHGQSWERGSEMALAMFLPAVPLLALMWLGFMSAHWVLPLQMFLMLPAMVLAMLFRIDDYTGHPR